MTTISLIEITFFAFWLWTLMDLINQDGVEENRKSRLITFHAFLGFIGIAFYFFLMISAYASEEVIGRTGLTQLSYTVIHGRMLPSLFIGFIVIIVFPIVAALNLILKGRYRYKAKYYILGINILEGLAILAVFIYTLVVTSWIEDLNEIGNIVYLISDITYYEIKIFGIEFGINAISYTFNIIFYLFVVTILIWFIAAAHYLFIIKIPIKKREYVILNTDEIKNLTSYSRIYNNAIYFLIGFAFILLRNAWDWLTGFRIKESLVRISEKISGLDASLLERLDKTLLGWIIEGHSKGTPVVKILERIDTHAKHPWYNIEKYPNLIDIVSQNPWINVGGIRKIISLGADGSWFKLKFGLGFYKFVDSFFAGNQGDVFSPGFVIGVILVVFSLIVGFLIKHINADLEAIQDTHEVEMNGLRHSVFTNFFDAWRVSLFAAIVTILLLIYFYPDPYFDTLKFVKSGIVVTFEVTVGSMILALILGLLAGLGKLSENAFVKGIASVYVEVIRGVPLLVQLFYIHFGLGRVLFNLPPLGSAVTAMAICYGAYMAEIFRAGIQSISHGQMEAAKSLGMTNYQTMSQVILPQGFKVILPPIGNEFIALLKDSSLVSIIAVADLLRRGREFVAIFFIPFEVYTLVALIYLVITLVLSKVVWNMEKIMATDD